MNYVIEGAYRTGWFSGVLTGIAAGTSSAGHLWAVRWAPATNDPRKVLVVQRLRARMFTVAGYTAAQEVQMALYKLTGYTVGHSAGATLVPIKKRTSMPTSLMTGQIASGAALTAGTQTISTESLSAASYAELAAAATVPKGVIDLFLSTEDLIQHPIILENNEGLLVRNELLMGAGGTMRVQVEMDYIEAQRYPVGSYSTVDARV